MPNFSTIRSLFLSPRPTYPIPDVAALLAIMEADVVGWIDAGKLEGLDTPEGWWCRGRSSCRSGWTSDRRMRSSRHWEPTPST